MNTDLRSLKDFMAGYFHEDWAVEAQSPQDVVAQFFRDQTSVEDLLPVARALRQLLDGGDDDETLAGRLFGEFGAYFDARGVGLSTRTWLESVASDFDREIAARR